jgi:hypothetical protein
MLLTVTLNIQIVVPALVGSGTNPGRNKKISLTFVYVRQLLDYCTCDCFDAHGQQLVFVSHHKPKLLPYFIKYLFKWYAVWSKKAHFPPFCADFFHRSETKAYKNQLRLTKNGHFFSPTRPS